MVIHIADSPPTLCTRNELERKPPEEELEKAAEVFQTIAQVAGVVAVILGGLATLVRLFSKRQT